MTDLRAKDDNVFNGADAPKLFGEAKLKRAFGAAIAATALLMSCGPTAPTEEAASVAPTPTTSIDRLDPAIDAIIAPGVVPEKIGGEYGFTEGPVWVNGEIRFSDLTGNKLYAIDANGVSRELMDKSGGLDVTAPDSFQGSNGSVVDKDGSVLMNQHGLRRIVKVDKDLKVTTFLDKFNGKKFNSPNDLVYAPDGSLWITDPPYGMVGQDNDPAKEQTVNAVYRYAGGKLTQVITDLPRPNGIGFSPDGKKLYVSNSEPEMFVNVYDVNANGTVANGKRFITFPPPNPAWGVPDGLKVDSAGNVWASGPDGIRVIDPTGKVLGQIKSPDRAQANLAFGGADFKTAYIMAAGSVYKLPLLIAGEKPLYAN